MVQYGQRECERRVDGFAEKPPTTLLLTDMSSLYGYIYCMLISEGLSGMPLYGGALYMIGRVTTVLPRRSAPRKPFTCPRRCDGCAFR